MSFLTRAIERIRDYSQSTLDEVKWTDAKLVALINIANSLVYEDLLSAAEPKTYPQFAEATVHLLAGQEDYLFPGTFRRFKRMVQRDDNGRVIAEILPVDYESDLPGLILLGRERGFRIRPKPTQDEDWTLVYEAGVINTLVSGPCPQDGTTTTLLASQGANPSDGPLVFLKDYYVNCYLRVISGTGPIGEIVRCTAYEYAAGVGTFTVTPAFTTPPQQNDVWELLPCVDAPYDNAIIVRAAMSIMSANGDAQFRALLKEEYRDMMRPLLSRSADLQSRVGPSMGGDGLNLFEEESY